MGNSRDVRNTKVNYQEKMSRVLIFIALLGTAAGFSTVPDSEWSALTGQWVQWFEDAMPGKQEDAMPDECLRGNSKNAGHRWLQRRLHQSAALLLHGPRRRGPSDLQQLPDLDRRELPRRGVQRSVCPLRGRPGN